MTAQQSANQYSPQEGNTDLYIRVRTDYYKIVYKPMTDGTRAKQLIRWKYSTIKKDHGQEVAEDVPCYDDFIIFPDTDPTGATYREWLRIAQEASKHFGHPFTVSDLLERHASAEQKQRKIDIADWVVEER